ncbi:unnamed protein product [Brassica oleracea]|uniref:(rape) hypothetical protein n=1 Tax=Brassica napus TaxID=3708 RepID=A0A816UY32_BRANA|nr:unnamed protein product [Brassica napus]
MARLAWGLRVSSDRPVAKVGAIIGRKGDIIRKMCEETSARIKVLDGPATTQDRVDSVDNGATIFPENQTPIPSGVTATTLLNENSDAFPELNQPDSSAAAERWPGWPGDCVFRVIVPVAKVGAIIGRKGDIIRKMCEETRARIKVLDGPATTQDRVVSLFLHNSR